MACRYAEPEQSAATGSLHFYKWTLKGRGGKEKKRVSCVIVAAFFSSTQAGSSRLAVSAAHNHHVDTQQPGS